VIVLILIKGKKKALRTVNIKDLGKNSKAVRKSNSLLLKETNKTREVKVKKHGKNTSRPKMTRMKNNQNVSRETHESLRGEAALDPTKNLILETKEIMEVHLTIINTEEAVLVETWVGLTMVVLLRITNIEITAKVSIEEVIKIINGNITRITITNQDFKGGIKTIGLNIVVVRTKKDKSMKTCIPLMDLDTLNWQFRNRTTTTRLSL
jgi:hypothetical protein